MARPGTPATQPELDCPSEVAAVFDEVSRLITRGGAGIGEADLEHIRTAGSRAAEHGMTARAAVESFLLSAAHAWSSPARGQNDSREAAEVMLAGMRAAVPVLVEGYQNAGQLLIRQDETLRREFIDDLLRGDADVAGIVQRAEPFGMDLTAWHQIVLAGRRNHAPVDERDSTLVEREVLRRYGDRDALVTTKGRYLLALVPANPGNDDVDEPAALLHDALRRSAGRTPQWRLSVGRPYPGVHGVARSYEQAREAMTLAELLHPDAAWVPTRDLLIYRVLGRDRAALSELVHSVLTPLTTARGGAGPLVDTLEAYFDSGEVATATARRLHVSVRTVTYRLAKVASLTGYDPTIPAQRLTLQASVVGARLLPWPAETPEARTGHGNR